MCTELILAQGDRDDQIVGSSLDLHREPPPGSVPLMHSVEATPLPDASYRSGGG